MRTSTQAAGPAPRAKGPSQTKPRQTARLFTNGASQAVRLPKEFRMEGKEVRIWKEGKRVVLEPVDDGWNALFEALEEFPRDFMIERNQPPMQERDWSLLEPAPVAYMAKRAKKK